jgi:RNA polymerase sigma-70 factor (ECF subfamily)
MYRTTSQEWRTNGEAVELRNRRDYFIAALSQLGILVSIGGRTVEGLDGSRAEPPSQDDGLRLVQRLLDGDPVATSDFAVAYLHAIVRSLRISNATPDQAVVETAAEDAIWSFITRPSQYDPSRMTILAYLSMAARQDLKNLLRAEQRHTRNRADWGRRDDDVELFDPLENVQGSELDDPARMAELHEAIAQKMAELKERVAAVDANLTHNEVEALLLVIDGERKTERFAEVLGLTHLPLAEQRREVKRFKDRMGKRLVRSEASDG